ncbi:hypothetical protein H323_24345, partial [Vibrio parahaemolyticus VP766]
TSAAGVARNNTLPILWLRQQLEKLLKGYSLPDNAKQLLLTCRQLSYYRHGRGIHPVEVQFQRTANSEPWQIVFFISFSYPFEGRAQRSA